MRIIATSTLKQFQERYPQAEQSILAWYEEVEEAEWNNPNQVREYFCRASVLSDKRVVFNIMGNHYRLITDIEYRLKILFVVWFGTHEEYDKINAKTISYVKAN